MAKSTEDAIQTHSHYCIRRVCSGEMDPKCSTQWEMVNPLQRIGDHWGRLEGKLLSLRMPLGPAGLLGVAGQEIVDSADA
jgi:hypothetical protein